MATLAVSNSHVRMGSSVQDGAALFNRLQKPRLAVPLPPPSQPDPDQLQYEKELLAHQLKLAKSQISELQQQLTAPPPPQPLAAGPTPQPQPLVTLAPSLPDSASNYSPTPSPTSPGPAPARLAPTGYPPTTAAAPILIRRASAQSLHSLLPTLSAPHPSSVSSSVSGYLSQLAGHPSLPPSSPHHHSGSHLPHAPFPRTPSYVSSLPTSPTHPRTSSRSIPASPHHAPLTAFMHPSLSLRSLHNLERPGTFGRSGLHAPGDDVRSFTSDEARSRSDLLCDPLDMFASEELGLGSVQEDVQVESLQAEVDRLKAVVDLEGAEKLHLQRRVVELEDSNHALRRQMEALHLKLERLFPASADIATRDQ